MPRPIAQDHDDKRSAILKTAARIFAQEGYGRATMAEIARECGISKANIYHYYISKEALLFDILETHLRFLCERISTLEYPNDDPKDRLRFLMTEILLAYAGADAEHDVLLNATSALNLHQQDILRQYQREFIGYGRAALEPLTPPAIVADRAKMRALTMSVFGMLNWHYKWSANADEATRRDHAKLIADLTLGGIPQLSPENL